MRTKIALLFGVMALAAASAAPAAQGKIVTLKAWNPLLPSQEIQGYSTNLTFTTVLGSFGCSKWGNLPGKGEALTTEVVKNQADPAVLNGFSGAATCSLGGSSIPTSSEATGPVELFGNGAGKLPIKFNVYYTPGQLCKYTGVLNLTPYAGWSTAKVNGFVSAPGCGPAEVNAEVSFTLADGTPVSFVYS